MKFVKHTYILVMLLILLFSQSSMAEIKTNPTVLPQKSSFLYALGITSDYVPRGITQSSEKPSIQGRIAYNHSSGFYGSVTGVTVKFNDGNEAKLETDNEIGYLKNLAGFDTSLSVVGYYYPGADPSLNYNFFETKAKVSKTFQYTTLSIATHYSPNYFLDSGPSLYTPVFLNIPINSGFSFISDAAHMSVRNNLHFTIPDYWHWSVGIAYNVNKFNISVKYIDTSLNRNVCPDGCDSRIVFTVVKFF